MRPRFLLLSLTSVAASIAIAVGCGGEEATPTGGETPAANGERVHGLTAAQRAETLAKVGRTNITVGQFAEELASKGAYVRTRYNSPERRREFLDQMIRFELLAQEAERRDYDELPEVQRTRKQMMIRRFLEERFEQGGPEAIPEADIRAYYDEHRSEFQTPEQVRASHILFRDRATAQRVLRQLLAAPADLRLYRELAEQHTIDAETRDRFGDLRFFSRPAERSESEPVVPAAVAEAAFAVESIGGIHREVIQTEAGFHIVKLTSRRAAMRRTIEEADRAIRSRLHRDRREAAIQALIDELRAEADVEEDLDRLADVQVDLPEGESPTATTPQIEDPGANVPRINPLRGPENRGDPGARQRPVRERAPAPGGSR